MEEKTTSATVAPAQEALRGGDGDGDDGGGGGDRDNKVTAPRTDGTSCVGQTPTTRRSLFEAPPPEVPGDVFDRQRVMVGWTQKKVEETTALVLGCGGLGSGVAMGLSRLGVRKLILVDMDFVEATNLNRQVLFTRDAVGMRKVDAAKRSLEIAHNLRSEFETLHINAVEEWHQVVAAAQRSNVIFNCIDYGAVFDYATNSLAKRLGIPFVTGSSYANTALVNFFSGRPGYLQDKLPLKWSCTYISLARLACWSCMNITSESFEWTEEELTTWMNKNSLTTLSIKTLLLFMKEEAQMSGPAAEKALQAALEKYWEGKEEERKVESNIIPLRDVRTFFIRFVQPEIIAMLSPEHIADLMNIQFIPKDKNFPTRYVGSWVCVCVTAALLMVNAWAQDLVGETFPSYCNFSLNTFQATNSQQDGATGYTCPVLNMGAFLFHNYATISSPEWTHRSKVN